MKLGDYATLVNESVKPDQVAENFPYIGLEHIEADALRLNGIGKAGEVSSNKLKFLAGDTLFGKLRPYFRKVIQPTFDGICSTDIWVLRGLQGSDPRFLRYWVSSQEFVNHVNQASEGTRMPRAKWDIAKDHYLPEISHSDQKAIAHILGTLDDKIELNRKMNETLEEIAKAIFKSWFVDFDPVRAKMEGRPTGLPDEIAALFPDRLVDSETGEIPEGWKVSTIEAACDQVYSGGTPSTRQPEYWGGAHGWLASGETRSAFVMDTEKTITDAGIHNSSTKIAFRFDTVIASAGQGKTRGQTSLLLLETFINQSVIALRAKKEIGALSLFFNLAGRYKEFRQYSDASSSRGSLPASLLKGLPFLIPTPGLSLLFDEIALPIVKKIEVNLQETKVLADLRDTLLPKLISGELKVPDAETFLEEAGI